MNDGVVVFGTHTPSLEAADWAIVGQQVKHHNDYDQIHFCSNIVHLPVVDPMDSYSHGYIGTEGKKEDTY